MNEIITQAVTAWLAEFWDVALLGLAGVAAIFWCRRLMKKARERAAARRRVLRRLKEHE
jgi:hypothetical protein